MCCDNIYRKWDKRKQTNPVEPILQSERIHIQMSGDFVFFGGYFLTQKKKSRTLSFIKY